MICVMTYSIELMVATSSRELSGPSLPLTMKDASYVQYIIRHGKQVAKVIFDGYDQQSFSTMKPVCNDHLYNKIYYLWFIQ